MISKVTDDNGRTIGTAFNDANWGGATRGYLASIQRNLRPESFQAITQKAKGFAKVSGRGGSKAPGPSMGSSNNRRGQLLDLSDPDDSDACTPQTTFAYINITLHQDVPALIFGVALPHHALTPLPWCRYHRLLLSQLKCFPNTLQTALIQPRTSFSCYCNSLSI